MKNKFLSTISHHIRHTKWAYAGLTGIFIYAIGFAIVSAFMSILAILLTMIRPQLLSIWMPIFYTRFTNVTGIILSLIFVYLFAYRQGKKWHNISPLHGIAIAIWTNIIAIAGNMFIATYFPTTQFVPHWIGFLVIIIYCYTGWIGIIQGQKAQHKTVLSPIISKEKFEQVTQKYQISNREKEVIHLLLEGKQNADICQQLFISEGTAKNHIKNIYKKMNVKNKIQLVRLFQI